MDGIFFLLRMMSKHIAEGMKLGKADKNRWRLLNEKHMFQNNSVRIYLSSIIIMCIPIPNLVTKLHTSIHIHSHPLLDNNPQPNRTHSLNRQQPSTLNHTRLMIKK